MNSAPMPRVVAHRGASAAAPENTLLAMRRAAAFGARWAECDVRLTADETPVIFHDATLERTTNGEGRVAERHAWEIADLDAGAWFGPEAVGERVPTLDALLGVAASLGLGLNVEIKAESDRAAEATAAAVAPQLRAATLPLVVSSFRAAALAALRRHAPDVRVGLLCRERIDDEVVAAARALAAVSLHADHHGFDEAAILRVTGAGLWPAAYTVNDAGRATELWRIGVRTVITDRPDTLLARAAALGLSDSAG